MFAEKDDTNDYVEESYKLHRGRKHVAKGASPMHGVGSPKAMHIIGGGTPGVSWQWQAFLAMLRRFFGSRNTCRRFCACRNTPGV